METHHLLRRYLRRGEMGRMFSLSQTKKLPPTSSWRKGHTLMIGYILMFVMLVFYTDDLIEEPESEDTCGECNGSGFGTLSDGACSTCYDEHVERYYGRKL